MKETEEIKRIAFAIKTNASLEDSISTFRRFLKKIESDTFFRWGSGSLPTGEDIMIEMEKEIETIFNEKDNYLEHLVLIFYMSEKRLNWRHGKFYYSIETDSYCSRECEDNYETFIENLYTIAPDLIKGKGNSLTLMLPQIDE